MIERGFVSTLRGNCVLRSGQLSDARGVAHVVIRKRCRSPESIGDALYETATELSVVTDRLLLRLAKCEGVICSPAIGVERDLLNIAIGVGDIRLRYLAVLIERIRKLVQSKRSLMSGLTKYFQTESREERVRPCHTFAHTFFRSLVSFACVR